MNAALSSCATPRGSSRDARQLPRPGTYEWTDRTGPTSVATTTLPRGRSQRSPARLAKGNVMLVKRAQTATEEYLAIDQEERL